MAPEIDPKSFGTFEKQAPVLCTRQGRHLSGLYAFPTCSDNVLSSIKKGPSCKLIPSCIILLTLRFPSLSICNEVVCGSWF